MRIKVQFGFIDSKEVSWYKPVEDFPKIIKFLGRKYEWVLYDKDLTGKVDIILTFSELKSYDPNYNEECPTWDELFGDTWIGCECGSHYSSFPWDHMRFCKLWKKW